MTSYMLNGWGLAFEAIDLEKRSSAYFTAFEVLFADEVPCGCFFLGYLISAYLTLSAELEFEDLSERYARFISGELLQIDTLSITS